jgi:hypothetical protein
MLSNQLNCAGEFGVHILERKRMDGACNEYL